MEPLDGHVAAVELNDTRFEDHIVTAINQSRSCIWLANRALLVLARITASGKKSEWTGANLVWPGNGDLVASTAKSKGISLIAPRRSTTFAATNCSYRG
jgi:hypothetical protein